MNIIMTTHTNPTPPQAFYECAIAEFGLSEFGGPDTNERTTAPSDAQVGVVK
jgi:hypothetical protein